MKHLACHRRINPSKTAGAVRKFKRVCRHMKMVKRVKQQQDFPLSEQNIDDYEEIDVIPPPPPPSRADQLYDEIDDYFQDSQVKPEGANIAQSLPHSHQQFGGSDSCTHRTMDSSLATVCDDDAGSLEPAICPPSVILLPSVSEDAKEYNEPMGSSDDDTEYIQPEGHYARPHVSTHLYNLHLTACLHIWTIIFLRHVEGSCY